VYVLRPPQGQRYTIIPIAPGDINSRSVLLKTIDNKVLTRHPFGRLNELKYTTTALCRRAGVPLNVDTFRNNMVVIGTNLYNGSVSRGRTHDPG